MSGENRVKLSERIYERAKALWPRYLTHPFVTEMADGTLPKEKFRYYMVQDYLYLRDYVKIFAAILQKTDDFEQIRFLSGEMANTIDETFRTHLPYMKRLGITQKKIRHAMLIGGGRVSYYLAQMLIGADVHVKIIENNPQRSEQLAQMLPEAAIICADGANQEILEAEGLNETDALVTLTGIDEQNIITSMVGNAKGVPHIVTKVNRIMTTGMVETLPMGSVVSPKELCSANIVQYVRAMQHQTGAAVTLHRIADGRAEALEFIVNKQSKYIGEPLKNLRLRLKKNILISCITHHGNTVIPDGESYYQLGDTVIIVTTREQPVLQFNDIFV